VLLTETIKKAEEFEIDSYFREAVTETTDSIKWWQQNKFKYPNLYRLVKRYVCIPATSCPSEKILQKLER
jgi:hypothetical protein